jgi:tRNA threonylcarbamoyladenosine biosynthesis protein TsaE
VLLPFSIASRDPGETESVGAELATLLRTGDRVVVRGDIGAGKTTFVRGVCRALGVVEPVTSPTYTIARRYEGGSMPVSHLDLYRLTGGADAEVPGLLDEEVGPDRLALIEWPEMASAEWLSSTHEVRLTHIDETTRGIEIR